MELIMKILICGGKLIDPEANTVSLCDILIENGLVAKVKEALTVKAEKESVHVINATGLMIAPGLVDMHCHLREPGFEYKETIESGTRAAAKGGFTSVACMPNLRPVTDSGDAVLYIKKRAKEKGVVHVFPIAAITKDSNGLELTDIKKLTECGAVAVSDDGRPVTDSLIMKRAMELAKSCSMPVISHCEDMALTNKGVMNEGVVSKKLGVPGIPGSSEEVMVAREVVLALETGAAVHIAHVSTKTSVALVRFAKKQGAKITCETCPHYFSLTEELAAEIGSQAKVNPPLRTKEDRDAVTLGLIDGTIDVIATDHAPHSEEEKKDLLTASSGFTGFETALSAAATYLQDKLTLPEIIKKMTVNPARILNLDKGKIKERENADLVIFDPDAEWTVKRSELLSKGKNSPFEGKTLKAVVRYTIVDGKVVYKD